MSHYKKTITIISDCYTESYVMYIKFNWNQLEAYPKMLRVLFLSLVDMVFSDFLKIMLYFGSKFLQ